MILDGQLVTMHMCIDPHRLKLGSLRDRLGCSHIPAFLSGSLEARDKG